MTRIWLVNWHFQSRITYNNLWCRHKSTNVSMGLCWQMPKFIVWCLRSIYFDHHLPLKPSIGKRRKQSCTPNISQKWGDFTIWPYLTLIEKTGSGLINWETVALHKHVKVCKNYFQYYIRKVSNIFTVTFYK